MTKLLPPAVCKPLRWLLGGAVLGNLLVVGVKQIAEHYRKFGQAVFVVYQHLQAYLRYKELPFAITRVRREGPQPVAFCLTGQ